MKLSLARPWGGSSRSFGVRPRGRRRHGTIGPVLAVAICAAAALAGIASAWWAIENAAGFERVRIGPWSAWPTAGEEGADPYLRARLARSGAFPLSAAEGVELTATTDASGATLTSQCVYRLIGRMPAAQWWTLTAYQESDRSLMRTAAGRTAFRSDQVLRRLDDTVEIMVAARARPGNWLPVDPAAGDIRLVLRLYDTPLATGGKLAEADVPSLERVSCG